MSEMKDFVSHTTIVVSITRFPLVLDSNRTEAEAEAEAQARKHRRSRRNALGIGSVATAAPTAVVSREIVPDRNNRPSSRRTRCKRKVPAPCTRNVLPRVLHAADFVAPDPPPDPSPRRRRRRRTADRPRLRTGRPECRGRPSTS